jgi:hypothetical protein
VDCSEPPRAADLLARMNLDTKIEIAPGGLSVSLPAGTSRDVIAEVNRVLVEGGVSVYRLQEIRASLESWFLQVTTRLGDPQ